MLFIRPYPRHQPSQSASSSTISAPRGISCSHPHHHSHRAPRDLKHCLFGTCMRFRHIRRLKLLLRRGSRLCSGSQLQCVSQETGKGDKDYHSHPHLRRLLPRHCLLLRGRIRQYLAGTPGLGDRNSSVVLTLQRGRECERKYR
jgi:hypothetical protein